MIGWRDLKQQIKLTSITKTILRLDMEIKCSQSSKPVYSGLYLTFILDVNKYIILRYWCSFTVNSTEDQKFKDWKKANWIKVKFVNVCAWTFWLMKSYLHVCYVCEKHTEACERACCDKGITLVWIHMSFFITLPLLSLCPSTIHILIFSETIG